MMHKLNKCLLIAYYFPPRAGMGSQRPSKLATFFPEFGWEPIILTAKLPGKPHQGMRIIETDYKDVLAATKSLFGFGQKCLQEQFNIHPSKNDSSVTWKAKLLELAKDIIAFPDGQRGWYRYAMQSARQLLDKEKVDVILSTSSPVTCHIIARELKKEYQIPWVADLRDLWTQNHFYHRHNFMRYLEKRLELKTFQLADSLVTVTPGFAYELKLLHKNKTVYCITNGYDSDDFKKVQARLTSKFTITYTGVFYNGKRDPSLLFEVLSGLIEENRVDKKLIEVRFYGPQEDWLLDSIRKHNLEGVVNLYGNVSHERSLEKQKESQLLLLLLDINDREKDVYPAKIFEYFGAGRPIIALGGSGKAVQKLLEKTDAGEFAEDKNDLKKILCRYYHQYITSGEVSRKINNNVESYSYKMVAKKYSDILMQCSRTKKLLMNSD